MPAFKNYQRTPRNISTEQLFNKGMNFTDVPLLDGSSKLLVNYNIAPEGNMLFPRSGYHRVQGSDLDLGMTGYAIHHTGYMTGFEQATQSDFTVLYTMIYLGDLFKIVVDGVLYTINMESGVTTIRMSSVPNAPTSLHRMDMNINMAIPVYTALNGSIVLPVNEGLGLLSCTKEAGALVFTLRRVQPREVNPSEASASGYNMLSPSPYTFSDRVGSAVTLGILGIVPQDSSGTVLFSARKNEKVYFRAYFETSAAENPKVYRVVWEFYSLTNPKDPKTETSAHTFNPVAGPIEPLIQVVPVDWQEFGVRVTVYDDTDIDAPVPVCTGVYSNYKMYDETAKSIDPIAYDLSTVTGMCTWMQHVVVWGTSRGRNMVFISELARPNYFPFPYNANIFDEDVITCIPYLNGLLVFTTTKLHKLSWMPGGAGFTSAVVQEKLQLHLFDHRTICVVQTMVFFKSGDYYYMIVPKATSDGVGALQMAPISMPITKLLDDMGPVITSTFRNMYESVDNNLVKLCDYINYQDNGVIRCIYKYECAPGKYMDFYLNYSTVLRTWTTYMMESTKHNMCMYRYGVTDGSTYASIEGQTFILITPSKDINDDFLSTTTYRNIQLLDTGYREHNTATKKRYREIQLKINNLSRKALQFGSMFYLDEEIRKDLYDYTVEQQDDRLVVVPTYKEPAVLAGNTVLSDTNDLYLEDTEYTTPSEEIVLNTNTWQLDVSSLSEPAVLKVRLKVSGKGYSPRLVLVSLNLVPYELLGFNWVFRTMNAR